MRTEYMGVVRTVPASEVVVGDVLHYRGKANYMVVRADRVEDEVHIAVNVFGRTKNIQLEYVPEQDVQILRNYRSVSFEG